ncbi:MAG: hypothetical protein GEV12_07255 [Micromonosporaceae bacterium]|nr:hypothetical protein [Micromonosporaceae bacterium]
MSWTFNPPPGWPAQPEGWQPPPGWAPDPSWPPAPPDWQFWVPAGPAVPAAPDPPPARDPVAAAPPPSTYPASTYPAGSYPAGSYPAAGGAAPPYPTSSAPTPLSSAPPAGEPGRRPWQQQWWAAGGAALAVLLVGCLGGAAAALVTNQDEPTAPPSTAPPEPTGSPTPGSATPVPAPSGSGLAAGQERTGEGPAIVELDLPEGAVRTMTVTFTGTESYEMSLVDGDGEVVGFLGTGSGDYTGTHLLGEGFLTTETPAALDIVQADGGSWAVQVQDIADAPVWPAQSTGTGNTVLQIDQNAVAEPVAVTGTHDGEANFIVWAYSVEDFGDVLLFNEIDQFSGAAQEKLAGNVSIMEIQADGAWTVRPD